MKANTVKKPQAQPGIEMCEEPEIQYNAGNREQFAAIVEWLAAADAAFKKKESDSVIYYDTRNNRLLREAIECRVKLKGGAYRWDLKTPVDTTQREARPDKNGILWRNELKVKSRHAWPDLAAFWGQAILAPVEKRVKRLFDKELFPKFVAHFTKEKYDVEFGTGANRGRVEFSLQQGYFTTLNGKRRTSDLFILELELREGSKAALLEAKRTLEAVFGHNLSPLEKRKVIIGFEMTEPDMNKKQRRNYRETMARNGFGIDTGTCGKVAGQQPPEAQASPVIDLSHYRGYGSARA